MVKHLLFTCSGSPAQPDRGTGVTSLNSISPICAALQPGNEVLWKAESGPLQYLFFHQNLFFHGIVPCRRLPQFELALVPLHKSTLHFIETWFQPRISAPFSGPINCASAVWWSSEYSGEVLQFSHTSAFLDEVNSCWILHQIPVPTQLSASWFTPT